MIHNSTGQYREYTNVIGHANNPIYRAKLHAVLAPDNGGMISRKYPTFPPFRDILDENFGALSLGNWKTNFR